MGSNTTELVWHLLQTKFGQGRLTNLQLKIGKSIHVGLACCTAGSALVATATATAAAGTPL